jgi:hypothetical protein
LAGDAGACRGGKRAELKAKVPVAWLRKFPALVSGSVSLLAKPLSKLYWATMAVWPATGSSKAAPTTSVRRDVMTGRGLIMSDTPGERFKVSVVNG